MRERPANRHHENEGIRGREWVWMDTSDHLTTKMVI